MHKITLSSLLVVVIFLATNVHASALRRERMVGGRTEVKDVKSNEEVQKIGKFSVQEYNREMSGMPPSPIQDVGLNSSTGPLDFVEVVKAQTQVVSGIKYYLKVKAVKGGVTEIFDAVVVVQPWVHQSKKLLNFSPSPRSKLLEAPRERM